jgi:hypothetical protein
MIAYCPDRGEADGRGGAIGANAPFGRISRLLLLVAGAAIILSSTAAIAHIMEWFPASATGSDAIRAPDEASPAIALDPLPLAVGRRRGKTGCTGCGAIVSMRDVGASRGDKPGGPRAETSVQAAHYYEFTIRMRDGSSRVITDANPSAWRVGERVHVIDSVTLSRK